MVSRLTAMDSSRSRPGKSVASSTRLRWFCRAQAGLWSNTTSPESWTIGWLLMGTWVRKEDLKKVTFAFREALPISPLLRKSSLVFPLRHHRTLQKRDSWILIFATPAHAREYQKEASELRHVAARFTSDPSSSVKSSHHLGPQGPRIHEYTLTSPFQSLSLVAQLSPFEFKLQRGVNTQAHLTEERHPGRQTFPVRLWIDQFGDRLSTKSIRAFLELDGQARGSPWKISEKEDAVVRLGSYSTSEMSQDDDLDEDESHIPGSIDNWCIDFQHASDAKRFVRVWHRKCLPNLNDLPQATVRAECLFWICH
jgi:hypothetical protein